MLRSTNRYEPQLYSNPKLHHSQCNINGRLVDLTLNTYTQGDRVYINDHIESVGSNTHSAWVPPNDRELIIRAKLKTGWNSRNSTNVAGKIPCSSSTSDNGSSSSNCSSLISDLECLEIEQVLQRAAKIDQKEMSRINNLYERWNLMNKPLGNGHSNCLICNCNFGILESSPKICNDCLKNVCATCSIDTCAVENAKNTIHLCRICSEYREVLKKSGAWFNKKIPSMNQGLIANCSPLKSSGEMSMSSIRSSSRPGSAKLNSNIGIADSLSRSRSSTGFKRLSDYSDDDFVEDTDNQSASVNGRETDMSSDEEVQGMIPALAKIADETETKKTEEQQESRKSPAQSISSMNISKNLKEEFERETLTRQSLAPLSNASSAAPEHAPLTKSSLTDLKNLPASVSHRLGSAMPSLLHDAGSVPNLNSIKDQIAASRNLKASESNSLLQRSGLSMVNLATSNGDDRESSLGSIQFSVEYIRSLLQLKIFIKSASKLASRDSNGLSDPYVKLHLLPGIAKATKLRSKTVYKNLNPMYNEWLHYDGITLQDLDSKSLRLTVLDEDKFGYDFIGEYRLQLSKLRLDEINNFDVKLEPKQELGDEEDLTCRGKINFALKYSKSACCLYVKINRCRQLLPMDNGKSSDPFVEISLLPASSPKENKHSKYKTNVKKKTLDPEFCEEFKFQNIDLKSLLSKTIEIVVWDKDFGKNDYIGSVLLSQNRTGDELKHFFTMVKNTEIYHEQWHTLENNQVHKATI